MAKNRKKFELFAIFTCKDGICDKKVYFEQSYDTLHLLLCAVEACAKISKVLDLPIVDRKIQPKISIKEIKDERRKK